MSNNYEENISPGLLPQGNWTAYNTLSAADSSIAFKTPGIQVYIVSEDKFYYWNGVWIQESGGSGPGPDIKVKVSVVDTVSGFLEDKFVDGDNTVVTKNNAGGNETLQIDIDNTDPVWASAPHGHPATGITYNNLVTGLMSSNVQDAIDETNIRINQLNEDAVAFSIALGS